MQGTPSRRIARSSVASLFLQANVSDVPLATATGFMVDDGSRVYLVTNWHVVTGRDARTQQPLDVQARLPDRLVVVHNVEAALGRWQPKIEALYDTEGRGLWLEHPTHRDGRVDAVMLPLTQLDGVARFPYDPRQPGPAMGVGPSTPLSIIGFPFGMRGGDGFFAVWAQGFIATEHELDYENLPLFLIDSRTRPGQSGSPVIRYSRGGAVDMEDGGTTVSSGEMTRFLGVYSGRVNSDSDIGFVWKAELLVEILDAQARTDRIAS